MRTRLLPPFALMSSALLGCKHDAGVAPQCYAGVVLGQTCTDGVIIQVAARTPIGGPARVHQTSLDSLVGSNAVAAVNDLGGPYQAGQTIYFTYAASPSNQGPVRNCTQNTAPLPIPHLVLSNVSTAPCAPATR